MTKEKVMQSPLAPLGKGVKPEDLKLDDALGLLRLPRLLGEHPESGKVQAGLGRFGPYVVWDKGKGEKDYRSLKGEDDVLAVGLSRALELLAMPKRGRGGRTALKDLGKPEGSEETVQVFDGPYGLYVKQGKVNASLPEGKGADDVTLKEAIELLEAKAATKKTTKRKTSTTKSTSKAKSSTKSASTKPAARKAPATTKTGRLRASAVRVIRPGDA